ncbi:MAG: NYN domain-containing protein [Erysipelotrichales bacterium]|nr:NYN domain-containing protein [Erysipelotrichales bacterium]
MEIKDKTIALLIDSDNISREYFSILLDELSQYGRVTYRRLYGDFSKPKGNGWKDALLEYSIEQVQQIAYTKGKNASDSSMIIDAMDILYKGKVDCFCLATSDSDFTGLAMRFRNDNLVCIGAGEKKTPEAFRKACDRFIPIDELLEAKEIAEKVVKTNVPVPKAEVKQTQKPKTTKKQNQSIAETRSLKLVEIAKEIIDDNAKSDGWMHFSLFMSEIYRKENEFSPKLYGHSSKSVSTFFRNFTIKGKTIFILKRTNTYDQIKLNQ